MVKGLVLQILSLESVDSTQRYLIDRLKTGQLHSPVAVTAKQQKDGKGSRGNSWTGLDGNLFLSFAIARKTLPSDLKLESSSIYFTYLLKETLSEFGSKVWLKWPNDFYIGDKKIGGAITNLVADDLVCGIGLNLQTAPQDFGILDIEIEPNLLLESYFKKLEKRFSWKQVFSKFAIEFENQGAFFTHHNEQKIALKDAVLLSDGSIECNGQRIFSLR